MPIEKLQSHKLLGIDQIPAELIKAGGGTILYENHKLIISIWNKEELSEEWKESIIVHIYKKDDKTDCSNNGGISFLPTTYTILSNIMLSRLNPYAEEIIGDHQCGFQSNRSTIDHIFCIRQVLEKKWEYNEAVHQLFIDFKKAYDSVRRENLYNILTEFGILMKVVRLIKMCLTELYSRVQVGKNLSDMFPIRNGLKQGYALLPMLFNFALECATRRVQVIQDGRNLSDMFPIRNGSKQDDDLLPMLFKFSLEYATRRVQIIQDGLKLNGTHQLLVYTDDVNILGGSVHTIKENTEALIVASKETGLEVNADKTGYMVTSRDQNAG